MTEIQTEAPSTTLRAYRVLRHEFEPNWNLRADIRDLFNGHLVKVDELRFFGSTAVWLDMQDYKDGVHEATIGGITQSIKDRSHTGPLVIHPTEHIGFAHPTETTTRLAFFPLPESQHPLDRLFEGLSALPDPIVARPAHIYTDIPRDAITASSDRAKRAIRNFGAYAFHHKFRLIRLDESDEVKLLDRAPGEDATSG